MSLDYSQSNLDYDTFVEIERKKSEREKKAQAPVAPQAGTSLRIEESDEVITGDFDITYGSIFSSILAKENLYVQVNEKISTAFIDLQKRTVHLPKWKVSKQTYKFLMCHELSHAIWTDVRKWISAINEKPENERQIYQQVLNVVEDCRIDRMIKTRYPGVIQWYIRGITDLIVNHNFFKEEYDKVREGQFDERAFVDRINVFYKTNPVGNIYDIKFTDDEKPYIDRIDKVQTFDEVKVIADELFEKLKQENKELFTNIQIAVIRITGEGDEEGDGKGENGNSGSGYDFSNQDPNGPVTLDVDPNSDLGKALKELVSQLPVKNANTKANSGSPTKYVIPPHGRGDNLMILRDPKITDKHIIPIHKASGGKNNLTQEFIDKSVVNYMASVFERRMDARDLARTKIAETGIIDVNSLHKYRYDDDIFKRSEITNEQKNHGFVFLVDCSGSISSIFKNIMEYTYKFVQFCERLGVPFEVYGFSDGMGAKEVIPNSHFGSDTFGLIKMFDSKFAPKVNALNLQYALAFNKFSGTPLSTSLNYIKVVGEEFKKKNRVDVLNIIVLTDGGCTCYNVPNFVVDDKTKTMMKTDMNITGDSVDSTSAMYHIIRQRLKCNVFNVFIEGGGYNNGKTEIKKEHAGTTATFFVSQDMFRQKNTQNNLFIQKLVELMTSTKEMKKYV